MKSIKGLVAKGFSLIELMISAVVGMVLIGILSLVIVFAIWGTSGTDVAQSTVAGHAFASHLPRVTTVVCADHVNEHGNVRCTIVVKGSANVFLECTESGCFPIPEDSK